MAFDWLPPGVLANTWNVAMRSVVAIRQASGTPDAREAVEIGLLPPLRDAQCVVPLSGELNGGEYFTWQHEGDYAASDMTAVVRLQVDEDRIVGAACLVRPPCAEADRNELLLYMLNQVALTDAAPQLDVAGHPSVLPSGEFRAILEQLDAAMERHDQDAIAPLIESIKPEAAASPLSELALDVAALEGWAAKRRAYAGDHSAASEAIDLLRRALDLMDADAAPRGRGRACQWLAESYALRDAEGDLARASRAYMDIVELSAEDNPNLGWLALRMGVIESTLAQRLQPEAAARAVHAERAATMFAAGRQAFEEAQNKGGQVEIAVAEADACRLVGGDANLQRAAERYGEAWRLMTLGGAMGELAADRFETLGRHIWKAMQELDRHQFGGAARSRDGWRAMAVFLRPLTATRTLLLRRPGADTSATLEMALSDALAPDVSMVYVGGTPHPSGADWTVATSSTSSWEIAVQTMLGMRNLAIVVPGYTPGMQWELRYLTENGMLERSLFIMLPADCDLEAAERWERTRLATPEFGLELPPYDPAGAFLRFGPDGKVAHRLPLESIWQPGALLAALRDALDRAQEPIGTPASSPVAVELSGGSGL